MTQYVKDKFKDEYVLLDVEARNVFCGGVTTSQMKCSVGYNPHGMREKIINENKSSECPLCGLEENWSHIVQCPCRKAKN